MKTKTFFTNLLIFTIFFILTDVLFSNFFFTYKIGYKCYNYNKDGSFYELSKNCYAKMRLVSSIDSFKVYTNEFGERYSGIKKNIHGRPIFFFGDSFTFGVGSNWEDTFVGVIEKSLKDYDIYNFAVPSYSPTVYFYKFENVIKNRGLQAKKIFVVLDLTDVSDESERWKVSHKQDTPFTTTKNIKKLSAFKKFKRNNFKGSHLIANYLRENSRKIRKKFKQNETKSKEYKPVNGNPSGGFIYTNFEELTGCNTEENRTTFWTCGGVDVGLIKIEKKFKKFGDLTRRVDAELYIIIYPWPDTLNFGQKQFNWEQYANKLCDISDCKKVINLFPEFNNIKSKDKDWLEYLYLPNDIHLTRKANKLMADKILKEAFNF